MLRLWRMTHTATVVAGLALASPTRALVPGYLSLSRVSLRAPSTTGLLRFSRQMVGRGGGGGTVRFSSTRRTAAVVKSVKAGSATRRRRERGARRQRRGEGGEFESAGSSALSLLLSRSPGRAAGALSGVEGGEVGGSHSSELGDDTAEGAGIDEYTSLEQDSSVGEEDERSTDVARGDAVARSGNDEPRPPTRYPATPEGGRRSPPVGEEEGFDAWLPRFFPPPQDGDDENAIQPLVELPLDGVLLQLFPVLLIGVLGLVLTVLVQVDASRFDGMVGEDGGAVVVTDLRETKKPSTPPP